jgi:peptidyl-prolyl cis-trans isomerase B (cyclophilin B)
MKLRTAPLLLLVALAGCGSSSTADIPSGGKAAPSTGTTASTTTTTASAPAGCTSVSAPKAKPNGTYPKPTHRLNPNKTWIATVATNCGTFAFKLDLKQAPNAASSIAFLASKRFFDSTTFHRIVPGFVIQGGDPTGTGQGGPGYKTVDKPRKNSSYKFGTVAMAKTANEAPGTAGSQFFVVTGADAGLPADYAVVGKVVSGVPTVKRIGKLGDQSQQPTTTVEIRSLRVRGS